MHEVKTSETVAYAASEMFQLVADIDRYKEFLPCCKASRIIDRKDGEVTAELRVAEGPVGATFTTRNNNHPDRKIEMHLVDGPFESLDGFWLFEERPNGRTQVSLDIRFDFPSHLLGSVLDSHFKNAMNNLIAAFKERAQALYGPRPDEV